MADNSASPMMFCVFSFNRGRFLRNCIDSIESCVENPRITVFDDNSDCPDTKQVLDNLAQQYEVVQPGHESTHHLGGLYGNMQTALEHCRDEELLCYLQDDTQMVRKLGQDDYDHFRAAFRDNPKLGFLQPCFIRVKNRIQGVPYEYDPEQNLYFRGHTNRSSGRFFSALLVTSPKRLQEVDWFFEGSEPDNNLKAQNFFCPVGYMFAPFAMWLPGVPAYRGKRKTLGLRLAEKKNCGFYPIELLPDEEIDYLKRRPPEILPWAEDFLKCRPETPPTPWTFGPLAASRWLKLLNQIEISLRRLFSKNW